MKTVFSYILISVLMASAAAHAADKCSTKYDPKNEVVAYFDKAAKRSVVPSDWVMCNGKAVKSETECAGKPAEMKFKFGQTGERVVLTITSLSDARIAQYSKDLAKSLGLPNPIAAAQIIKTALAQTGFSFNADLCLHADQSPYVKLVGVGLVKGKEGEINLTPGPDGIQITENIGNAKAAK